ncbi:MAG: (Fe-S)-binding protein, partial [Desulfovibrionales bacterium]|nr:(Fe-S)-binding protein [Desulfovibrionales bacterium]
VSKFMEMRSQMTKALGDPLAIRSLVFILARNHRIRLGAGLARVGQRLAPPSLSMASIPLERLPKLNPVPLGSDLPEVIPPQGPKRGTLLYFTGCATQYIFGDTGRAAVKLLTHLGYEIIIPRGQTCCGIPMMFHGARDKAVDNMKANVAALARAWKKYHPVAIITDCSTCGTGLRDEYPALIRDHKDALDPQFDRELALTMASKVRDILSIIGEHKKELSFTGPPQKVTYHLPCHTKNSFNGQAVVTDLLNSLDCFDHCPAPDMASCCGGGGTFFYEYPELSQKMSSKKILSAQATGADTWLTDCPVCRINLSGHLPAETTLNLAHPLVVMAHMLDPQKPVTREGDNG